MNIKRIAVLVIAATQLAFFNASAATISELHTDISVKDKCLNISGKLDKSDGTEAAEILIKLLRPGKRDIDIENDIPGEASSLIAVDRIAIDKSQTKFVDTIGLRDDLEEGRYYIYFSGNGVISPDRPSEIWFYKSETLENETKNIVSSLSQSELKSKLFDDKDIYPEDTDDPLYDLADLLSLKGVFYCDAFDDSIAKIIYSEKAKIDSFSKLNSVFETASLMGAFEKGNTDYIVDSDWKLKKSIFQTGEFAEIEDKYKTIFDIFSNDLNLAGRKNTVNSLCFKQWTDIAGFKTDFAKQTMYNAVYNNLSDGFGHIPGVITACGSLTGVDFSDFEKLSQEEKLSAANKIKQSNAADFEQMCRNIKSLQALEKSENNGKSTSGNTRNTGSSINVSAEYIDKLKDESNKNEQQWAGGFNDIENYRWAKDAIEYLMDRGIVSGTGNNTFSPQLSITRGEFAKMLVLTMGYDVENLENNDDLQFADVDKSMWYAPYVFTLKVRGIINGDENNNFMAVNEITRQDACAMIYRAVKEVITTDSELKFSDADDISEYARKAVAALSDKKIIVGNDKGMFLPENNATRAEAAVIFYRLLTIGGISK